MDDRPGPQRVKRRFLCEKSVAHSRESCSSTWSSAAVRPLSLIPSTRQCLLHACYIIQDSCTASGQYILWRIFFGARVVAACTARFAPCFAFTFFLLRLTIQPRHNGTTGTLGIFLAVALQRAGLRVAVVERASLRGRAQEWNISRKEVAELVRAPMHAGCDGPVATPSSAASGEHCGVSCPLHDPRILSTWLGRIEVAAAHTLHGMLRAFAIYISGAACGGRLQRVC